MGNELQPNLMAQVGANTAQDVLGMALGMATAKWQDKRQLKQAEKLQDLQLKGQQQMADYQQGLALDMWNKTNYEQQMQKMKEAGLSPGLMYKGAGAGGTTAGAGQGGGVSGQQATATQDLGMALQLANIEAIKAGTRKTNAEADVIEDGGIEEQRARINQLVTSTEGQKIANAIQESTAGLQKAELETRIDLMIKQMQKEDASIEKIFEEVFVLQTENALKQKQIELTDAQIEKIDQDIKVMWKNSGIAEAGLELQRELGRRDLDRKDLELVETKFNNYVRAFEANVKQKYPNLWSVIGASMDSFRMLDKDQWQIDRQEWEKGKK